MKAPLFTVPNYLSIESWKIPSYLENPKWRNGASLAWAGFLLLACVIVFAAGSAIAPVFASGRNLHNLLLQGQYLALIAAGAVFVFANGGVDLSIGAMAGVCGLICGSLVNAGQPLPAAMTVALLVAIAIGAVNGSLVALCRVPSFLLTLGAAFLLKPFMQLGTENVTKVTDVAYGPVSVFFWIVFAAVFAFAVFALQVPGRMALKRVDAAGEGVGRRLLRIGLPFAVSTFMAGAAGILMTARLGAIVPTLGTGFELEAIFAVLVGGCIFGARYGNPLGTLIAALFIALLHNLMAILGMSYALGNFISGAILVATIGIRLAFDLVVAAMYRGRTASATA